MNMTDILERQAPAALNTVGPDPERTSSRYKFVPTIGLANALVNEHGFNLISAHQVGRRTPYGLHYLSFEHQEMSRDSLQALGDTQLRIWLRSAHNGRSSYQLGFGLFRLVCSNGLTIMDPNHSYTVKIRHVGSAQEMVSRALPELTSQVDAFLKKVQAIQGAYINEVQIVKLANAALEARGIKDTPPSTLINALNESRRAEDVGGNLWRVMNRIQENAIHGVEYLDNTTKQGYSTLRPTNSYGTRAKISTALFNEAVKIAA